ncbi:MAG: hypothetical protein HOV83_17405 [Catenulispora sp.]|nr:hypothetical protein [Catenulispora sp.]
MDSSQHSHDQDGPGVGHRWIAAVECPISEEEYQQLRRGGTLAAGEREVSVQEIYCTRCLQIYGNHDPVCAGDVVLR